MGGGVWWSIYRLVGWLVYANAPGTSLVRPVIAFVIAEVFYRLRFRRNFDLSAQRVEPVDRTSLRRHSEFFFPTPNKIIRLLNKRGFRSGVDGWSCAGSDGARVKPGVAQFMCRGGKG